MSPVDVLMLGRGGVALVDSADASRCYPDLWRTPAAARQAFHRQRRVTGSAAGVPGGGCHAPLRRATYQRAGTGKRPASLVFDPTAVVDLRSWLEERIGPLARFEPEEATSGAAEPIPAEPGGASGPLDHPDHPEAAPAAPVLPTAQPKTAAPRPPAPPDRIRLSSLVQRLEDARPKQRHGVRRLDFEVWTVAAREAAALPRNEWMRWRATVGTVGTSWPPSPAAPPPAGYGTPSSLRRSIVEESRLGHA